MRLFVAVVPPVEVVDHLDDFLDVRRDHGAGLRWSPPHQWHVTLAFMGEAPERVVDDLVERVGEAATRTEPIPLSLTGGGCFPDVARARLLFARVGGEEALAPLARAVRSACSVTGAQPDGGPFRPHLTVARAPRALDLTRWVRVLDTYRGPTWSVDEVALVASTLPRERGHGPHHETVARLPLGR